MNTFLWWSGAAAWLALGLVGLMAGADAAIDWIVGSLWTKKEFMTFVWDRLKQKRGA